MIQPPWTATLTQAQHDLVLFGLVTAGLTLLATLVRVRFAAGESSGRFRGASLTANAVVALALISYVVVVLAFVLGYRATGPADALLYVPLPSARYVWAVRYMDWAVTVPLLVIELVAVSSLAERSAALTRRIGMVSAVGMIVSGFLGAFVLDTGRSMTAYTIMGIAGAAFFAVLYVLFFRAMLASLPRLPEAARSTYRAAIVLLLTVWLAYPIVYGLFGAFGGGAIVVIGQLILCAADLVAKIGFGSLVHRTAVLLSRNEDDQDPARPRRPRRPVNDSIYVPDSRRLAVDPE